MVEPNSKSKYLIHPSSVRNLSCINFLPLIGSSCSNCQMIGFKYRSYNWKVYKTMKCSQGFYVMLPKCSNADGLFKEIVHYHISHTHHSNSHWLSINSCNKTRYIAFVCLLNSFVIQFCCMYLHWTRTILLWRFYQTLRRHWLILLNCIVLFVKLEIVDGMIVITVYNMHCI